MARWLANENVPGDAVRALRATGLDVAWVLEDNPGSQDAAVLARAAREARVLLTFDKDFGELVFRAGASASCGVVLCRIETKSPAQVAAVLVEALASRGDWEGCFAVIEPGRIRLVPLPGRGS